MTQTDIEEALGALAAMIVRTEKAQEKFAPGTSHCALLENRLKALRVASALIPEKAPGRGAATQYAEDDLKNALAPLASLIGKSEKARAKLAPDAWQRAMLDRYLKALYIAMPLLTEALNETDDADG